MPAQPFACRLLAHPLLEVGEDVGPLVPDVTTKQDEREGVASLDQTVAAGRPVAAEHDQVRTYIVAGMLADVVEGQPPGRPQTERTLAPFEMEVPKDLRISNTSMRLRVVQQPLPDQWLRIP